MADEEDDEDGLEAFLERLSESSDPAEMAASDLYDSIANDSRFHTTFDDAPDWEVIQLLERWIVILRERMSA